MAASSLTSAMMRRLDLIAAMIAHRMSNMSCRCRWIDSASVRGLIVHGYSLIDRKLAVGVGATWRFAETPPNLAASTHARASIEVRKGPPTYLRKTRKRSESYFIESDFPVDTTTREQNSKSRRRSLTNSSYWTRSQIASSSLRRRARSFVAERSNYCDDQDLRSLPRICERKIKSLAIPYEPLIQVQRTQSAFHPRAQRNAFRRLDGRQQSRSSRQGRRSASGDW